MAYCKFLENLPHLAKILFAILLNPLFVVYRFIVDIMDKNYGLVVWDALLGVVVYPFFWVCNIIWACTKDQIFSFSEFFGKDGGIKFEETNAADKGTSTAGATEVKAVDKKPEEPKAEEPKQENK